MNILVAVLNSFWQATALAALLWLALRVLPRVNASTRYVIWFAALLLLLVLPAAPVIVDSIHVRPRRPAKSQSAVVATLAAGNDLRAPLTIEQPAIVTLPDLSARWFRWLIGLWAVVSL